MLLRTLSGPALKIQPGEKEEHHEKYGIQSTQPLAPIDHDICGPHSDPGVIAIMLPLRSVTDTARAKFVWSRSKPHAAPEAIYTTSVYDLAGRITSVTTPDSAVVTSSYSGNRVLVADQAGKERISLTDGLGRLNDVWEVTGADSATEVISFPSHAEVSAGYHTSYQYDTLDNLTTVSQGSQTRTFAYDSLKRLSSAINPESGTICYGTVSGGQCQANGYDANGNLVYKTDARGVVSTFGYDALNRNTNVTYTSDPAGTLPVTRVYDLATNGKGRLYQSQTTGAAGSLRTIAAYDALGRPTSESQQFYVSGAWSQPYTTQRTYDLAGHVKTQTYPSNHTVTYNYDAAGRLGDKDAQNLAFTGYLGDGVLRTYSSEILYTPLGGMSKEKFGTDTAIYNKLFYNSRGQLAEIREGTSYTGPGDTGLERGAIINFYGTCWGACGGHNSTTSMADNNGNLKRQEIYIPNESSPTFAQTFDYDSLNRLQRVTEGSSWQQEYVYDRYGNRTIHQTNTWGPVTGPAINKKDFTVNTANNRLGVPGGQSGTMSYDNAGNLTTDSYSAAAVLRAYDAENRMTKETQANSVVAGDYTYNADGQRVRRKSSGVETWQVYGMDGELLAEYAMNGTATSPQKEYGYRNGQLLITAAAASSGWGAPPSFTPPATLVTGLDIKLEHLTELRSAVNDLRAHAGLAPFSFTVDPNPTRNVTTVKADHIRQLRTALEQARSQLGLSTSYAHPTLTENSSWIYATDFQELRNQILSAWNSGTSGIDIEWLVADQLGTPRMIFDKSGSLTVTDQNGNHVSGMTRHDYLPFGEELIAGQGGRTTAQGYSPDTVRQKFTQKERDIETGLDYFGARYYASVQGRFTGADPYDINLERQKTSDPYDADDLFGNYIAQPQHWNRYAYALNNPLRYIDPDGRKDTEYKYHIMLLGKRIKVNISDKLNNNDRAAIKKMINAAVARINQAKDLTPDQIKQVHKLNGLKVSPDVGSTAMNKASGFFEMKPDWVQQSGSIDFLAGGILHDTAHRGQSDPEADTDEFINNEKKASAFAAGIARKIPLEDAVIKWLDDDALTGHLLNGKLPSSRPPKKKKP